MALSVQKLALSSILLLLSFAAYCGERKIYGTVKGDDGMPVGYCLVKVLHSEAYTYSDEKGYFSLVYDINKVDSFIFFCLGYQTQQIMITGDSIAVVLQRKVNDLNNVTVSAHRNQKVRHGIMGKKHLKQYGICTGHIGQESAIFLQADPERHGELEKIYFFISKGGLPGTRFRVHVYDIDTGYMPGNDLLDSNMILHANSGDEWVEADVSNMHILLSRSVFVSMEWISGYENNTDLVSYDK